VLSSKVGRLLVPNEHPQGTDTEGFAASEVVARARAIAEVCEAHGTMLLAAAIAFPFPTPPWST
jgi:hypothetical protein